MPRPLKLRTHGRTTARGSSHRTHYTKCINCNMEYSKTSKARYRLTSDARDVGDGGRKTRGSLLTLPWLRRLMRRTKEGVSGVEEKFLSLIWLDIRKRVVSDYKSWAISSMEWSARKRKGKIFINFSSCSRSYETSKNRSPAKPLSVRRTNNLRRIWNHEPTQIMHRCIFFKSQDTIFR